VLAAAALLAGGCGSGEQESAAPPAPDGADDQLVVVALGDSITAGNPGFDPDPAQRRALGFGDDERSQYEYWAERANRRLEILNCGVFGERTDEIAARLGGCIEQAAGADALIVQGGINDIAQGRPLADAAADLRGMVERGKELGFEVALAEVLPWNNGHPLADQPITELNRLIAGIGREQSVAVLDFHETLEDPRRPGLMGESLTSDGDHPSIEGYRRLGELVAAELGG
jgi:lysophospholipase L1-like esterase